MSARDILDGFVESQGWDDDSIITLLCHYIDNQLSEDALVDFLQRQADEENEECEEEFESPHDLGECEEDCAVCAQEDADQEPDNGGYGDFGE